MNVMAGTATNTHVGFHQCAGNAGIKQEYYLHYQCNNGIKPSSSLHPHDPARLSATGSGDGCH